MTHTYQLTGMTCGSCESKVQTTLAQVDGVEAVEVSKEQATATIRSQKQLPFSLLESQLSQLGDKYSIYNTSIAEQKEERKAESLEQERSWFETYKPVLLIFTYIFLITGLIEFISTDVDVNRWMRHFMAGFFLTFSFFKMLNLKGFKESYQMYDVIAKRIPSWGYVYAFAELILGVAFLINYNPVITNTVTLVIMSISIIGVLQSVLNKQTIKCACLGDVFNLPMSTVTIIEDGLMIAMSAYMLFFAL